MTPPMRSTATTMRRVRSNAPLEKAMALEYDFPEVRAGGFSHVSSPVDFSTRIKALLLIFYIKFIFTSY